MRPTKLITPFLRWSREVPRRQPTARCLGAGFGGLRLRCGSCVGPGNGPSNRSHDWSEVTSQQRIVISKDEDFLFLATRPDDSGRLLWLRLGNTLKAELLGAIFPRMPEIEAIFAEGQRIVELRA